MIRMGTHTRRSAFVGQRIPLTHPLATLAVLVLVGVLFGAIAIAAWQVQSAYAERGVEAQAVVVDKHITTRSTRTGIQHYHNVVYEFSVDGHTYRGESGVDEAKFRALSAGDALDILYLSNNPSENIPAANHSLTLPLLLGVPALMLAVVALAYTARTVLPWWASRRSH
jgi:hypothetical protein